MTIKHFPLLVLFVLLVNFNCREELILESDKYEGRLVIEGLITDENKPYVITLNKSSNINTPSLIPVVGCTVTIFDNTGYSEILRETSPGIYQTSETGIKGIVGNQYQITVTTPEGKSYKTEFQEMKPPVKVDSIYSELKYINEPGFPFGIPGYQFFVDTEQASDSENYFLWNLVETYEYYVDYKLYAIFDRGEILINGADTITKYNDLSRCWKTENVSEIFTGKTGNLSIPKITKKPLNFVNTKTKKLSERYSLLLKQYTITKDAYTFWNGIEEQITNENYLFTTQPYNVVGNLKNLNDPNEIIYGNFTVASTDSLRIFVDRPNVAFYYDICFLITDLESLFKRTPPIYLVLMENGNIAGISEPCLDCTTAGGIANKPDYWISK